MMSPAATMGPALCKLSACQLEGRDLEVEGSEGTPLDHLLATMTEWRSTLLKSCNDVATALSS